MKSSLFVFLMMMMSGLGARADQACTSDVDVPCVETATVQPAAIGRLWGCIAAGTFDTPRSEHSAVGFATGITPQEAEAAAIATCEKASRTAIISCHAVKTFDRGCWFLSTGTNGNRVRNSFGDTRAGALNHCERGGYACKGAIGGCMDDSSYGSDNDETD